MSPNTNIGLWGATSSGKTTYLAALMEACLAPDLGWTVRSPDSGTADRLEESLRILAQGLQIPASTATYRWELDFAGLRTLEVPRRGWWPFGKKTMVPVPTRGSFTLTCTDATGALFRSDAPANIVSNLLGCSGLVYLYDPLRELQIADPTDSNVDYFRRVLISLPRDNDSTQYIEQNVAVCLVKYDHPQVFSRLDAAGLISRRDGSIRQLPSVPDPESAFRLIADQRVQALLSTYVAPQRLRFFCTSALGFFAPEGVVDPDDYWNQVETAGGVRLRGPIHPVGVFEPLLWLHDQLTPINH